MSALPKMGTATPYPPRQNSPYMKVDNYNDGDDGHTSYLSFFLHRDFLHTYFSPHKFRTKTA